MFVFSHHSSSAHSDEVVCCGLIETGGLILQLKDVQSCPWLITRSQIALFSPPTGKGPSSQCSKQAGILSILSWCRKLALYL